MTSAIRRALSPCGADVLGSIVGRRGVVAAAAVVPAPELTRRQQHIERFASVWVRRETLRTLRAAADARGMKMQSLADQLLEAGLRSLTMKEAR